MRIERMRIALPARFRSDAAGTARAQISSSPAVLPGSIIRPTRALSPGARRFARFCAGQIGCTRKSAVK